MIGKLLKWTLRIVCVLVGLIVLLLVAGFFVVNSTSFQQKLLQRTTSLLEDKLQTNIQIDSVSIDLWTLDAELYRLCVEDRQQRKMLQMDYLKADVDIWPLLNRKLRISEAKVKGLHAELHHMPHDSIDSIANYQFVIDAFKKDPHQTSPREGSGHSPSGEKKGGSLTFIMNKFTAEDIQHKDRHRNFSNTLNRLLELGVIPIINENDTIATEEIGVGDNDTLAAIVATSAKADLLVLLSDIDGLYAANPNTDKNAELIPEVHELDDNIMALGGKSTSGLGTGGMKTKLAAAKICTEAGCDMIIANGADPSVLYKIADGKQVGTRFFSRR